MLKIPKNKESEDAFNYLGSLVGRFSIGIKVPTTGGKERPAAIDYFRICGANKNSTISDSLKELVNECYGEKPKTLVIKFPSNDISKVINYCDSLELNGVQYAKGDGEKVIYFARKTKQVISKEFCEKATHKFTDENGKEIELKGTDAVLAKLAIRAKEDYGLNNLPTVKESLSMQFCLVYCNYNEIGGNFANPNFKLVPRITSLEVFSFHTKGEESSIKQILNAVMNVVESGNELSKTVFLMSVSAAQSSRTKAKFSCVSLSPIYTNEKERDSLYLGAAQVSLPQNTQKVETSAPTIEIQESNVSENQNDIDLDIESVEFVELE